MGYIESLNETNIHWRRAGGDFSTPGTPPQYPPNLEVEPTHLEITLDVDIENERVSGDVTTTVVGRCDGPRTLSLNAVSFQGLKVSGSEDLEHQYDGETIEITWSKPFKKGEERKVKVSYSVEKPSTGLFFSKPDKSYPDRAWFAATDHETERARFWLPCIDLPNVRTTLDFHLSANKDFTILANGLLINETTKGNSKTAHWKLEQRCPSYLVCFAIGDFVRCDDGEYKGCEFAYFTSKEYSEADLKRSFGQTGKMMEWMTKKLDMEFPYPKYYQFALPAFGGAMENISLVSWDDIFVLDETHSKEWQHLTDIINLHEMSHSYFGDAIVCRDYAHAWLKESWATYMEACWLEDAEGRDQQLYDLYCKAHSYFDEADGSYSRPIMTRDFKSSWEMYDRHLYPGGACRLHTLRSELGDDVFWAATQDYLKRYREDVVETDDFRKVMEEHSGRSLVQFFDQWILNAGYPDLKVSFSYDAEKKLGSFTVEQQQVKEDKDRPFVLRTELGWTIDGKDHSQSILIDKKKHQFDIAMAKNPQQVRFDPDWHALHKLDFNPGDDKLATQLTEAKDIVGRILAGRELCKTGKHHNVCKVVEAFKKEKFFGVREQFAKFLGKAGIDAALAGLAELISFENDPLVMEHVFRAAGSYRDQRILDALIARLNKGKLPYRAHGALLESLGAQRENAPLEILKKAATTPGHAGIVQGAALRALAATRQSTVRDTLLTQSQYGAQSFKSRTAAAQALAGIHDHLESAQRPAVSERLVDMLRDPVGRVQRVTAMALRSTSASNTLGALEAFRRGLCLQEQVDVEKTIKAIRSKESPKVGALEKQLGDLQDKYRSVLERLDKIEGNRTAPAKSKKGGATKKKAAKKKATKKSKAKRRR